MEEFLELGELLARLSAAGSVAVIFTMLSEYANRFGLTRMSLFDATVVSGSFKSAVISTKASQENLRKLERLDGFDTHPIVEQSRRSPDPFTFSALASEGAIGLKRALCADDVDPASAEGLIVPVHEQTGPVAIAIFTGRNPDISPLVRDVLKLAVRAGLRRASQLNLPPDEMQMAALSDLTPRELECLHCISNGMSDGEVARILSISARTVRFHIDNAKVKLKVATRVQAVSKLLRERSASRPANPGAA